MLCTALSAAVLVAVVHKTYTPLPISQLQLKHALNWEFATVSIVAVLNLVYQKNDPGMIKGFILVMPILAEDNSLQCCPKPEDATSSSVSSQTSRWQHHNDAPHLVQAELWWILRVGAV